MISKAVTFSLLAGTVFAIPSIKSLNSEITILSDNDLQGKDGHGAKFGALYLSTSKNFDDAESACAELGEDLWSSGDHEKEVEILKNFFEKEKVEKAWTADGKVITDKGDIVEAKADEEWPVLCKQSAPFSDWEFSDMSERWHLKVDSNSETLTGFRDHNVFRFRGVRFAPQPERFSYPKEYVGEGETQVNVEYAEECTQVRGGDEDCLFLNIWTSYLPLPDKEPKLKPVVVWLFGGGFTENGAHDPNFDGGNLASRGDVVMVAMNYRVGPFGYLAIEDGKTNGNFGLADQILAIDWVKKHIQDFGGDPEHVTIMGQSSGGASVRAIMGSPEAEGKFVAAIPMGTPGGAFSTYSTIAETKDWADKILDEFDCKEAKSPVDCLREVDAVKFLPFYATQNRALVIDGKYITHPSLPLNSTAPMAKYRLMLGTPADDGAPLINFVPDVTPEDMGWLEEQGFPKPDPELFPAPDYENRTLAAYRVGVRVANDGAFRCPHQATLYAMLENEIIDEVYYFEFDRTYQTPDWPRLDLCEPPRSKEHPLGDPNSEQGYFRCHSGQLLNVFGNVKRWGQEYRDEKGDREFEAQTLDRFARFIKGESPAIDGDWKAATKKDMKMLGLTWPRGQMEDLRDLKQCEWLKVPLNYLA